MCARRLLPVLAVTIAAFAAPCGIRALAAQSASDTVHMRSFSVVRPAGKGWDMSVDSAQTSVTFARQRSALFNPVQVTTMSVFANGIMAGMRLPDADAVAADFLAEEERIMNEDVSRGEYRLEDVRQSIDSIGGRRVHTIRFRKVMSVWKYGRWAEEAALHVWFPDDFAASRRFYCFLMSEYYLRGGLNVKVDLTQIEPLIASLVPRSPVIAASR
jgi:hypothetical protein